MAASRACGVQSEMVPGVSEATADHQAGTVSVLMLESADIVAVRGAILDAGFTTGGRAARA